VRCRSERKVCFWGDKPPTPKKRRRTGGSKAAKKSKEESDEAEETAEETERQEKVPAWVPLVVRAMEDLSRSFNGASRSMARTISETVADGFLDVVTELRSMKGELRDMQREYAYISEAMNAEEYRPAEQPEGPEDEGEELHVENEEVRDLAAERAEQEALAALETESGKEKRKVRKEKKRKEKGEKKGTEDGAEGGEVEEPEGSQTMRE
jgi:hypothetical protein